MNVNSSAKPSRPLTNDIFLAGECIEIKGGGGGFETVFIASERKVIHKKWIYSRRAGKKNTEEL